MLSRGKRAYEDFCYLSNTRNFLYMSLVTRFQDPDEWSTSRIVIWVLDRAAACQLEHCLPNKVWEVDLVMGRRVLKAGQTKGTLPRQPRTAET